MHSVSASNFGEVGGETSHRLTLSEMPSHSHEENVTGSRKNGQAGSKALTGIDGNIIWTQTAEISLTGAQTGSRGSGAAHNNMPPYIKICAHIRAS